ncbi:MAG: O-antigen ligase family protein [Candidatus Omnitrophica bacterium]|nr:O-antigen ligase family protein [Candidatus Omnitrophota bacterium]
METKSILPPLPRPLTRPEIVAGTAVCLGIGTFIWLAQSAWLMAAVLVGGIGLVALWYGAEYIPLVLFLQLAFSVEIPLTGHHRLTVPTEVLIPLLFLMFVYSVLRDGKITYRPSALNIPVVLFYFLMVATLSYTLEPVSTLKALIRDTGYIGAGYFLIPKYIQSEARLRQTAYAALGIHTVLVLYGFLTQIIGGLHIYGDIASPFFIEHCIYAAFVTITFSFLLAFFLDQKSGPLRYGLGILTGIFGLAIVLTFVRAAWFSVLFLLLFYLYHFRKRKSAVDLIVLLLLATILGLVLSVTTDLGALFLQRIDTVTDLKYVANYDRIDRWTAAWNMWKDHRYLGVGWGAYPDLYFSYQVHRDAYSSALRMGAHNIYLEIMAETGLVGIMLYLIMLYVFYRRAFLLQRTASGFQRIFILGMQGAMLTYLIHAFVNNLGPSDKIGLTFWFLLGLVPTLEALQKSQRNTMPPAGRP